MEEKTCACKTGEALHNAKFKIFRVLRSLLAPILLIYSLARYTLFANMSEHDK